MRLLRELSNDEMEEDNDDDKLPSAIGTPVDPRKPWLKDFNYYINIVMLRLGLGLDTAA